MGNERAASGAKGLGIRPLSVALGAEISGVDLREPLSAEAVHVIRDAWLTYQVIVFHCQHLSVEEQWRFCSYLGEIGRRLSSRDQQREPSALPEGTMYVSNLKQDGKAIGYLPDGEMQFHIDLCYVERPSAGAALHAIEIPSTGGDTLFSNLYTAYETLPDDIKTRIAGRKAVHFYDHLTQSLRRDQNSLSEDLLHCAHPVVRTHPDTSRKALFVNRLMTSHIEGLDRAESDELLQALFDQIETPDFIYAHRWQVGDLLIWDNRCTAHARTYFDPNERRHLARVILQGDAPF